MISIDFSLGIALYIVIILNVVLIAWIFTKRQRQRNATLDPKFLWFCSICSYAYINTKEELISTCPRCGSYNKK
ncbi:MAG TPA: hypothetical protein VI976_03650 [Candidatus Omnitrophota bacterium]|nr:hypothetical protein [Candidatus Omnitrophota bacterium]